MAQNNNEKPTPKIYEIKFYGKKYHIILQKDAYVNNGTLAVSMLECTPKGKVKDYFGTLTVNLVNQEPSNKDEQYIDTNNNGNEIIQWLKDNKIAEEVGIYGYSGYCGYPLFKFTKEALDGMLEE